MSKKKKFIIPMSICIIILCIVAGFLINDLRRNNDIYIFTPFKNLNTYLSNVSLNCSNIVRCNEIIGLSQIQDAYRSVYSDNKNTIIQYSIILDDNSHIALYYTSIDNDFIKEFSIDPNTIVDYYKRT